MKRKLLLFIIFLISVSGLKAQITYFDTYEQQNSAGANSIQLIKSGSTDGTGRYTYQTATASAGGELYRIKFGDAAHPSSWVLEYSGDGGGSWSAGFYNNNQISPLPPSSTYNSSPLGGWTVEPGNTDNNGDSDVLLTLAGANGVDVYNTTPPVTVTSVTRTGANPTNASSVVYQVVFSGSVTGVTGLSFTLTSTDLSGASISGVTPVSGTTYNVTANTGTVTGASGSLRLDVNGSGVSPTVSNAPYTGGDVYTIDKTPPNTTITANPPLLTNSTSATFEFTSTETGSTFEGSLDGGAYVTVTSPLSYTGLSEGSHTFAVRAKDAAGNVDATSASYTWTIDLTAPNTTITTGPLLTTNSTSATFTFTSAETGSTFEGSLDGGAYATVTSPSLFTGLSEGSHTFAVRAKDAAGNVDATSASYTWTVDLTAPTATISSTAGSSGSTTSTSPVPFTVTFSESVTGFVAAGITTTNGTLSGFTGSGTMYNFNVTPSADGAVTVNVPANEAQDAAGNNNTAASVFSITYIAPNNIPTFAATSPGSLAVCQNSGAAILTSLLTGSDADNDQTLTWSVTSAPTHGTLGGFPYSVASTGGSIVPAGLTYTPSNGFSGSDVFTIALSDGVASTPFTVNVTINALPTATIAYGGGTYCATGTTNITRIGTAGGTYTSTTGLSIDASTGAIDLSGSTPGAYTVTYTFSNGTCSNTATTNVTINALPTATIAYAGSPYLRTGTADVTLTGATGGTYTSTTGLSINASTGVVDLAASTPGTYTVTYTFSNGTCSNTTTAMVVISNPVISTSGSFAALSTTYGTASAASNISVSGTGLPAGITATPSSPAVFEVSADGISYNSSVTIGSSGAINGTIYVRLKANAPAGTYNTGSISLTSTGANNPTVSIPSSEVSKALLTYTANTISKFYGDNVPFLSGTVTGFVNGENAGSATTGGLIWSTSVSSATPVGNYAITGSGLTAVNYDFAQAGSNASALTVTPAPLTITANNQTKAYGADIPTLTVSYAGFVNGDTPASLTTPPTLTTIATSASSVAEGPYPITASGASDPDYTISYVAGILTVTPATLTITANSQTKVYGADIPALTASYAGFVNGDTPASLTTPPALTTIATSASSVAESPYPITASGASDPDYTINYIPGILTVTQASLTITANNQTKAYGADIPTLTVSYAGFVNGDTPASLTTPPALTTIATSASSVAGGPYLITASGASDPDYTISYVAGILTVTPATLTITANSQTKVYGADIPALTASYAGFVNGDTPASLTTPPALTTIATSASSVAGSPYPITASGASDPDYAISYVAGILTVTQVPLTITADSQTKVYGADIPALTASYAGFVNGDTPASLTTPPVLTTIATSASSVAGSPYPITASGASDPDYAISYVAGILTVTQAPLTITANNQTKAYGADIPALTASYAGFVNGDTPASLTTPPILATPATSASSVAGSPYPITASGASDPDYTISYIAGILTVTQAPLTITATGPVKPFGTALTAGVSSSDFTATATQNGEVVGSVMLTPDAAGLSAATPAGSPYEVTPSAATGTGDFLTSNYNINYVSFNGTVGAVSQTITFNPLAAATYGAAPVTLSATSTSGLPVTYVSSNTAVATVSGSILTIVGAGTSTITAQQAGDGNYLPATDVPQLLTVNPADITVTADAQSKSYGEADPALTYQVTSGSLIGTDAFSGALTRTAGEAAGSYPITQGTLALDANYNLTYAGANLTIGQRDITVTADAQSKIYGEADPALTYQITSGSLVGTDAFSGALTRTAGEAVGSYPITQGTLALDANYNLTYAGANLTIGQRDITVTADAQSKIYGEADPALTYQVTSGSLVGTDAFSGALTRTAGEAVGSYPITQGTLALDANYNLTYAGANLTIGQRDITVTADAQSKIYGEADPALTYQVTSGSLVGTDAFSGALTRTAGEAVGSYPITQGTLALDANYNLTYAGANLTIGQATQTITFNAIPAKTFGDADFTLGATASSGLAVTYSSSDEGVATVSGNTVHITGGGTAIITASQAGDANYTAATPVQQALTVNQAAQTITFNAIPAKTFGDADFTLSATASSGLAVTYSSSDAGVATVSGNTVHITGGGTAIITASQAGDANYTAATPVQQALTVNQIGGTTITFNPIAAKTYGDADFDLTASSSNSGVPITFSSSNTAVATVSGNTVHIVSAGTAVITASQAADADHAAPADAQQTLTVNKSAITVTADAQSKVFGAANPALTYKITSGALVGADSFTGSLTRAAGEAAGSYDITQGTLALNNNYNLTYVGAKLTITTEGSVISFAAISAKTYGDADFDLTASSSNSGVPITFSSSNTAVATVSGNTVHIVSAGTAVITASQAADADHAAPADAQQTLTVNKSAITVTADAQSKVFGAADPALTYKITSGALAGADNFTGALSREAGEAVGTYNINRGTLALSSNYALTFKGARLTIGQSAATITFIAIPEATYGDGQLTLSATASSGLPVSFRSSDAAIASVNGNKVTIKRAGRVTFTASQPGDADHNAATDARQTLIVKKATLTVTAGNATRLYGEANPAFAVSYSGFVNDDTKASLDKEAKATTAATRTTAVGSYDISPAGAVSDNYSFNYVNGKLTIAPTTRTLTFDPLPVKTYGDADFDGGAKASGGEAIIYSGYNPAVVTITNGKIHITGAGTTAITATLAASGNYSNTPSQSQTLTVNKADQLISFGVIPTQLKGVSYDLGQVITASSGLPVTFSSSDQNVATVSGSTLNALHIGTTVITATQGGDANYNTAQAATGIATVNDQGGDDIIVHQAVSPNGDGINDYLYIEGLQSYPDNTVIIFNRNAVLIWQGHGYDNGSHRFDGHSNVTGALQQAGTYFYKITYTVNGNRKEKTGYFILKY